MADQTISQLNLLTGPVLGANDELPIVDISASETKKIRAAALVEAGISLITDGSIDLIKLNQNSATKLGTIAFSDASITAPKLADNSSIAATSVAPSGSNFAGRGWFSVLDHNLFVYNAGNYEQVVMPSSGIANGAITTAKIAANAITDATIQVSGLSSSSIAAGAIITSKIADSGITTIKIADSSITNAKLAANTIQGDRIAAEAVGTAALASGAITSVKFAPGAVNTAALGVGAVTNEKIANTAIEYSRLNLSDGDIPGSKITTATISGLQISAGGVLTSNIADSAVTNVKIAASGIGAGKLAANAVETINIVDDAITTDKIADGAVGATQLASSGVTAAKLANSSATVVQPNAPIGNGTFVGQHWFDTSTKYDYVWDGSLWTRQAGITLVSIDDTTPLNFAVAYPDSYSTVITTSLDDQNAARVFAGPASGSASAPSFRALVGSDLPVASSGTVGAARPGAGLSVDGTGAFNHSNSATPGVYAGPITIDAQGHITSAAAALSATDIPNLDASKITTGTFSSAFLAANSVTAQQLADYGIAQVSETAPTPEFAGQWWVNPNDRSAYIWVGTVTPSIEGYWLNLGYGSPTQINLRFGGTYNASGNTVTSINSYGIEAGLTIGQGLATPNTSNNGIYLIVTASGVGSSPAPAGNLAVGNWVLSEGTGATWTKVTLGTAVAGVGDQDVLVDGGALSPIASGVASQEDFNEVAWGRIQIANLSTAGITRASTEIVVASGTGIMSIGVVDDGSY